jgi:hypothetical protein
VTSSACASADLPVPSRLVLADAWALSAGGCWRIPRRGPGGVVSRSRLTDLVWLAWAGDARARRVRPLGRARRLEALVALGRLRRRRAASRGGGGRAERRGGCQWVEVAPTEFGSGHGDGGSEGGVVVWCGDVSASKLWARAAGRFFASPGPGRRGPRIGGCRVGLPLGWDGRTPGSRRRPDGRRCARRGAGGREATPREGLHANWVCLSPSASLWSASPMVRLIRKWNCGMSWHEAVMVDLL